MGRKMLLGIVLLAGIVIPSAWPEAAAPTLAGKTTFAGGWSKGEPTLRVQGGGVTLSKRVGREHVSIRVEVKGDVVELQADTAGKVRIGRQGRFLNLQMKDSFEASIGKVQKLMAGSAALDGLEGLVASLAGDDRQEARSVLTSYALLHAVRGSPAPTRSMVNALKPKADGFVARASLVREEVPSACWAEYASTVNNYMVEFSSCLDSYWWIPGWTSACAFQFSLQAELAWFWLISCSGGMPV
jgi:hypothetical protein